MRFCTNCGAQQKEESKFCSECGNVLTPVARQETPQPEVITIAAPVAQEKKEPGVTIVFGFLNKLAAILSAFFAIGAIGDPYIDASHYVDEYGYSIGLGDFYFAPDDEMMAIAFGFGLTALVVAIVNLILTLIKNRNMKSIFSSIVWVVLGAALTFIGAIFAF